MMEAWTPTFTDHYDPLQAGSIDMTDTEPHDNGIARAMVAQYKAPKHIKGDQSCTIFVGRLSFRTTEDVLRHELSKFGDIRQVSLVRDVVTGFSKGYAFVEFANEYSAKKAYRNGNYTKIDDKPVFIDYEHDRSLPGWIPRRLGGGLGGKKESGQLRFGGRDKPFREPIIVPEAFRKNSFSNTHGKDKVAQDLTVSEGRQSTEPERNRPNRERRRSRSSDTNYYQRPRRSRSRERRGRTHGTRRSRSRERDRYRR